MIKIPNYDVLVPTIPDITVYSDVRNSPSGNDTADVYSLTVTSLSSLTLPFTPVLQDWVEIYIDSLRLINPTSTAVVRDPEFVSYSVAGNVVTFSQPVTGNLEVRAERNPVHWWGATIVDVDNIQARVNQKSVTFFEFDSWPIKGGTARGTQMKINYEPGAQFIVGGNVFVKNCNPNFFNGLHTVKSSTLSTVTIQTPIAYSGQMKKNGTISGTGNGIIKTTEGIGYFCEPIIVSKPYHGYVRLTKDRKSLAYTPDLGYSGNDTFAWSLINQHGQIGDPKCCMVKVGIV